MSIIMNEKIRELAEQAEKYANEQAHRPWHHSSGFNPFKEKFAELIVRECADIIEELAEKLSEQRPNSNYDSVAYECAEVIKTHFGVEL